MKTNAESDDNQGEQMMSNAKGNVVIAGDKLLVGIDEHDQSKVSNTLVLVIEFRDPEAFHQAIKARKVEFTLFGGE